MEVKNHWEIQKKQKKQNVETNGGEKPLGNPKKSKNKMWRPMVGSRAIGLHIFFFVFFDFPMVFHPHWSPHFVFLLFF